MNILITICGRAGSKGAKGKNRRLLLGHPLIYYTQKCAHDFAEEFKNDFRTDVIVSSDGDDILESASVFPDTILHKRSSELAQDVTPKVAVIQDATLSAEKTNGLTYDYVIDLDITSPLRKPFDIRRTIDGFQNGKERFDVVFSAVEARRNPYFNMVELIDNQAFRVKPSDFVCRQQAPKVFDLNASIFGFYRDSLINKLVRSPFEGKCSIIQMDETYVIDIDHDLDFTILDILINNYYKDLFPELFS